MTAHRIRVVIPEDHRLVVEVPEEIRSGPAEMVLIVEGEQGDGEKAPAAALARWDSTVAALDLDVRSFASLSRQEKRERLRLIKGIGKGLLPSSEDIARGKRAEVALEDTKLGG